ncbi:MAG: metalloregulator ArsR/SmtB family transcription factor [Cucumibacter sp.]
MAAATLAFDDHLDQVFQALGNRTRRALLAVLASGPAKVTDLARPFGISLNAVSKHLAVLERAGLIERTITGRIHSCALEGAPMADADAWLRRYRAFWGDRLDRLTRYVENDMP